MHRIVYKVGLCAMLVAAFLVCSRAQEPTPSAPAEEHNYELKLIWIDDAPQPEYLRVITHKAGPIPSTGYKSLYALRLRDRVKNLPNGTVITWLKSDFIKGGEPSEQEVKDFQTLCQTEGIKFLVYSRGG